MGRGKVLYLLAMKTLIVTLKDGHVYTGEKENPIWENVKVNDIESLEWKRGQTYEPNFAFRPKQVKPLWSK